MAINEIVQRLLRVQIEHDSAIKLIERYDSEETLFYCDPPYPHDSRGDSQAYAYEMTDEQHRELAQVLHNVKGKVAISGYECSLMSELYGDWKAIAASAKTCHSTKGLRTEVLWVNYNLDDISKQNLDKIKSQQLENECQPQQLSLI
jgi:DNA adenine methylase